MNCSDVGDAMLTADRRELRAHADAQRSRGNDSRSTAHRRRHGTGAQAPLWHRRARTRALIVTVRPQRVKR